MDMHDVFSNKRLLGVLMDLFIAGGHTTAVTMEWLILALCNYPEIQDRIHKELDTFKGDMITSEDQPKFPYLNAVLKECLRWRTVGPLSLPHKAAEDLEIMGYSIPKDTLLFENLWAALHEASVWPDPHKFNPERMLNLSPEEERKKLLFFGIGPRECLGKNLALVSVFLQSANILRNFSFKRQQEHLIDETGVFGLTLTPKSFHVRFSQRKKDL